MRECQDPRAKFVSTKRQAAGGTPRQSVSPTTLNYFDVYIQLVVAARS